MTVDEAEDQLAVVAGEAGRSGEGMKRWDNEGSSAARKMGKLEKQNK